MNIDTGELKHWSDLEGMSPQERARYVEVVPTIKQTTRGRVSRNDLCPCGSGIKFKRCCWRKKP
jgi:uncharacterized protein YecA (UPF0149 family)